MLISHSPHGANIAFYQYQTLKKHFMNVKSLDSEIFKFGILETQGHIATDTVSNLAENSCLFNYRDVLKQKASLKEY